MGLRDRLGAAQDGEGLDGVAYFRKRLLDEVDLSEFATLSEPQRRARLERVVGRMVSREGPVLSTAERTRLIRRVIDEAIGLGVLEPLLADPTVTEIMVNGLEDIFMERDGRIQRSDISFTDEAQLYQTIDRIVSQVNRRVDESSPMVDARLPTGERVNVIIPPLALRGPTASSSARSAAPRRSTCSRRSTRVTRARSSRCTRTRATTRSTGSRRWR